MYIFFPNMFSTIFTQTSLHNKILEAVQLLASLLTQSIILNVLDM